MSLHIDALSDLIRDSISDSGATVGDWLAALRQTFGAQEVEAARLGEWNHAALPKALAECLSDREEEGADRAVAYIREHKFDDEVWGPINRLFDEFQRCADSE